MSASTWEKEPDQGLSNRADTVGIFDPLTVERDGTKAAIFKTEFLRRWVSIAETLGYGKVILEMGDEIPATLHPLPQKTDSKYSVSVAPQLIGPRNDFVADSAAELVSDYYTPEGSNDE